MKAAVASDNNLNVTGHLGRCNGFIIYTIENNLITNREYRQNSFTHHAQREQGGDNHENHYQHSHLGLINGLSDCSIVFFNSGGWRVIEDLKKNNIQPFLTNETIADETIVKYLSGKLEEFPENSCTSH